MRVMNGRSFVKRLLWALVAGAFLGMPLMAEPPEVFPGDTIDFFNSVIGRVQPDDVDGKVEFLFGQAAVGITPKVLPLSSFVQATANRSRANSIIFQYNDVEIAADSGDESVVQAQISGTVNIRGYMLLVGWGLAQAFVNFEVIDITGDPEDTSRVIAKHSIAKYEIDPSFSLSMGTGLGAFIGSATAGGGKADLNVGIGVPMAKRVIRAQPKFGFPVLLRRGHTYRLQLVSTSKVKLGATAGIGRISLWAPIATTPPFLVGDEDVLTIPPSLVDPQLWVSNLSLPVLDQSVPSFTFPDSGIFAFDWFGDFDDTNDVLKKFDIPTDVRGVINKFMDRVVPDEQVTQPGVDLREMRMTVSTDQVELLHMISDQVEELKEILLRHPPHQHNASGLSKKETTYQITIED